MFYAINIRKFYKILIGFLIFFGLIFLSFKFIFYIAPVKYGDIIDKYSKEYSVDKALVYAVINSESRFNTNAISYKGASGLMQLMEVTAIWLAETCGFTEFNFQEHIFNPDVNIWLGTMYLSKLLEIYDGDEDLALASYNAGIGNVGKWLKSGEYSEDGETLTEIPFKETKNYLRKVKFYKTIYKFIFILINE